MNYTDEELNRIKPVLAILVNNFLTDYNKRLAKHLSGLIAFPEEEVLMLINLMQENKE